MTGSSVPLPDLDATRALAARLAPQLKAGDFLALIGELGTGKTTFARALIGALGVTDPVPSPTFTLMQSYETPAFPIVHFDLYRLKTPDELDELGWEDILPDSLTLVEWPERAGTRLPPHRLTLHFALSPEGIRFCQIYRTPP